jgi:hypothetical protein
VSAGLDAGDLPLPAEAAPSGPQVPLATADATPSGPQVPTAAAAAVSSGPQVLATTAEAVLSGPQAAVGGPVAAASPTATADPTAAAMSSNIPSATAEDVGGGGAPDTNPPPIPEEPEVILGRWLQTGAGPETVPPPLPWVLSRAHQALLETEAAILPICFGAVRA